MSVRAISSLFFGLTLGITLGLGFDKAWLARLGNELGFNLDSSTLMTATAEADSAAKKILYWVAPMDANYRRDGPGKSPMGMDLIPVYEGKEPGQQDEPGLKISPTVMNNIGIRTAAVKRSVLQRRIETVGYVGYDEDRISHVHLRTDGWIDELRVKYRGQRVKKGDLLFRLYSRALQNSQAEYQLAAASGQANLIASSRNNLRALGVSTAQIEALAKRDKPFDSITISAAQDGVITELNVAEGMYVQPSTTIATIADLSSVWVMADVFESQSQWVKEGQVAQMRLPYESAAVWEGVVDYVYPMIDPKTRTLKARLRFDNPGERLKPNMFTEVMILAQPRENTLAIPREALIRTGNAVRVITALNEGRFLPVDVKTGIESGHLIEILEGLTEDDKVVTSGQFLIDSESSLAASFQRMTEPETTSDSSTDMQGPPTGEGVINSLEPLNITHAPIPDLGWPTMTMDFQPMDNVSLDGIRVGDQVQFELEKTAKGAYAITRIGKADMSDNSRAAKKTMAPGKDEKQEPANAVLF